MGYKKLSAFPDKKHCQLCLTSIVDPDVLGEVYRLNDVIVHYFCLLLSSHIEQNGLDNQGILGFFPRDIKKEIHRGSSIECSYCHKKGATVKCCHNRCRTVFHVPCGVENGALNHFFDSFSSYCYQHKPKDITPLRIRELKDQECIFCYSPVLPDKQLHIWPPCCKPDTLFHKKCIQRMASSSGYYLKCALCNDKTNFCKGIRQLGIYIPEQEASWEQGPNPYQELAAQTASCCAEKCICPKGREHASKIKESRWALEVCRFCGSTAMHQGCMITPCQPDAYECSICSAVSRGPEAEAAPAQEEANGSCEEPEIVPYNEFVDSCGEHLFRRCLSGESCDGSCSESERESNVLVISSDDEAERTPYALPVPDNSRRKVYKRKQRASPSQCQQSSLGSSELNAGPAPIETLNLSDSDSDEDVSNLKIVNVCTIEERTFDSATDYVDTTITVDNDDCPTVVIEDSDASSVLGDDNTFTLDHIPPDKFLLNYHFAVAKGYHQNLAALPIEKKKVKRRKTRRSLNGKRKKKVSSAC